jgi:hypothetical protein
VQIRPTALSVNLKALSLFAVLAACDQSAPNEQASESSTPDVPCVVKEAPEVLEDALCDGSRAALTRAILRLKEAETSPTFLEVLPILDRVWKRDSNLGSGLDRKKLDNIYFRGELAQNLAPQVILKRSSVPLRELQEHAIRLSRVDAQGAGSLGIYLLGSTHTPGQVDFLRGVTESSREPTQRMAAIGALGGLCEPEAGLVLEQMRVDPIRNEAERKQIAYAIDERRRLSKRICELASAG